jgi:hypothetical protein
MSGFHEYYTNQSNVLNAVLHIGISQSGSKAGLKKRTVKEGSGMSEVNSGTGDASNPLVNRPEIVRQLIDQLKTAFIMGLLTLWLATLKSSPGKREAWWFFVIFAVAGLVLVLWVVRRRKKGGHPLSWWYPFVMLCIIEGVVLLVYWISGVSFSVVGLKIIGSFLLVWAFLASSALFLLMFRCATKGKLGKVVIKGAKWGYDASPMLSLGLFSCSFILGWSRLLNAGYRGWWIDALGYLGMAILLLVAWATPLSRKEGDS